ERTAAVWQADEQKQDAAASDAADHRQVLTLEGVALAGDRHPIRKITVMGSLWPVPSTPFRMSSWRTGLRSGSATGACSICWNAFSIRTSFTGLSDGRRQQAHRKVP